MFGIPNQHISTQLQPYGRIWTGILTGLPASTIISAIIISFTLYYLNQYINPYSVLVLKNTKHRG